MNTGLTPVVIAAAVAATAAVVVQEEREREREKMQEMQRDLTDEKTPLTRFNRQ